MLRSADVGSVVSPAKPVFQSVIDLGLRDVGVKNQPRRLAAHFGKSSLLFAVSWVISVVAVCAVLRQTGAHASVIAAIAVAWTAALLALAIRMTKRSPVVVMRLTADGGTKTVLWLIAPYLLLGAPAVVVAGPVGIPVLVLGLGIALFVWRRRDHVPEVLRELRPLLAEDEPVLGDGVGLVQGLRGGYDAFRLVVATDRRLLVAASTRSKGPFLLVDVPYRTVDRFGVEWPYRGRLGKLSLIIAGADGAPSETHVVSQIAPANLVSIARALRLNGVATDDPEAVVEAERAWEEAKRGAKAREPLLDRNAMSTGQFDRGLWLLLALAAVGYWLNPLGAWIDSGVLVLLITAVLCVVSGYVSGTKSSLAYIVPLNLLVLPSFLFAEPLGVVALMIVLSMVAAMGLWAGSALRQARVRRVGASAAPTVRPRPEPAPGSLRQAVSGRRLIRISGVVVAVVVGLVAIASAAGFDPATLRMVVDEAFANQQPVDGRSNLTGNDASLTYTPRPDLKEFIVDEDWDAGPNDGARWELRTSFTKGYNVVSLTHYIFDNPRLDNPRAVREFIAGKDREHSRIADTTVTHTERVVDGRKGYVWTHGNSRGYWHHAVWFPQPVHSIRVECVAKKQVSRFKRLCSEALESLEFH
jgi:hypothetical protein